MSVRQRENEGEKAKENERDFGDLGSHIAELYTPFLTLAGGKLSEPSSF